MNVPLLDKVIATLEAHPEQYDQRLWLQAATDAPFNAPLPPDSPKLNECGTVGCIAGHLCHEAVATGELQKPDRTDLCCLICYYPQEGRRLLGITNKVAGTLFSGEFIPRQGIVQFLKEFRTFADNPEGQYDLIISSDVGGYLED